LSRLNLSMSVFDDVWVVKVSLAMLRSAVRREHMWFYVAHTATCVQPGKKLQNTKYIAFKNVKLKQKCM